jgi:alkylation response protein AidB-like acyl-CoA dehydrogenase
MKMKNKLGTRQLPTAELLLDGCKAQLISEEGRGIASISNMLTVTRYRQKSSRFITAVVNLISLSN